VSGCGRREREKKLNLEGDQLDKRLNRTNPFAFKKVGKTGEDERTKEKGCFFSLT
jgi:hypothetical protein